jgi:two-component system nitrate/nitrite response regulator NarP
VVATASDSERLRDAIERLPVDVMAMGSLMPCLGAYLRQLRGRAGAPRIVVCSGLEDPGASRRVMALGGAGFRSKRAARRRAAQDGRCRPHGVPL